MPKQTGQARRRTSYQFSGDAARALYAFRDYTHSRGKSWKPLIMGLVRFYAEEPEWFNICLRPRLPGINPILTRPKLTDEEKAILDGIKDLVRDHARGRVSSTAHAIAEIAFQTLIKDLLSADEARRNKLLEIMDRNGLGELARTIIEKDTMETQP